MGGNNLGRVATTLEKPRDGFVNYIYLIPVGAATVRGGVTGVGTVGPGRVPAAGCCHVFPIIHIVLESSK